MVQLTFNSKKMLFRILGALPARERARFGRELRKYWNKLIVSEERRVFKILNDDLRLLIERGGFSVPRSIIIPTK